MSAVVTLVRPEWRVRPGTADDHPYVIDTWLHSDAQSVAGRDEGPGYMRRMKARIRALLASAILRVAADPADEGAICGWALYRLAWMSRPRVYYVYVRRGLRRYGMARDLLRAIEGPAIYACRPTTPVAIPADWRYDRDILQPERA